MSREAPVWEWDDEVGVGYLRLSRAPFGRTVELAPNVYVDYDVDGGVLGIEIL